MYFHDKWTCCLSLRTIAHVTKLWVSWGSYTNDFSPENTWMKTTSLMLNRDFSKTVISLKSDFFSHLYSNSIFWLIIFLRSFKNRIEYLAVIMKLAIEMLHESWAIRHLFTALCIEVIFTKLKIFDNKIRPIGFEISVNNTKIDRNRTSWYFLST